MMELHLSLYGHRSTVISHRPPIKDAEGVVAVPVAEQVALPAVAVVAAVRASEAHKLLVVPAPTQ